LNWLLRPPPSIAAPIIIIIIVDDESNISLHQRIIPLFHGAESVRGLISTRRDGRTDAASDFLLATIKSWKWISVAVEVQCCVEEVEINHPERERG